VKWTLSVSAAVIVGCAGAPQIAYESAPDRMQQGDAPDPGEAAALEQAEADCARQGKHAEARRVEGETLYSCVEND